MKLNAATRLATTQVSAGTQAALLKWIKGLSPNQQNFLLVEMPELINHWFSGFATNWPVKVKKVAPEVEIASADSIVTAATPKEWSTVQMDLQLNPKAFEAFVIGWSHLRRLYPPVKSEGKVVYRRTALPNSARHVTKGTYIFENAGQKKSLTSWTLLKNPKVLGRGKTGRDVILSTKLSGTSHILFDYDSVIRLTDDMSDMFDARIFEKTGLKHEVQGYQLGGNWLTLRGILKKARPEQEVALYLRNGERLECTVTGVQNEA